jgi:hypothetical protein
VDIDTSQASAPPIENLGCLKSKPNRPTASIEDHLKAIDLMLRLLGASRGEKGVCDDQFISKCTQARKQARIEIEVNCRFLVASLLGMTS